MANGTYNSTLFRSWDWRPERSPDLIPIPKETDFTSTKAGVLGAPTINDTGKPTPRQPPQYVQLHKTVLKDIANNPCTSCPQASVCDCPCDVFVTYVEKG